MAIDSKQAQRFVLVDGKRVAIEQVQTVKIVSDDDLRGSLETAYHICKGRGDPVMPTVAKELVDIAAKDCGVYTRAAEALGMSYRTFRGLVHEEAPLKYTRLKGLLSG